MFLSAVIPLTAVDFCDAPSTWGREAHALFLSWVQAVAPTLAEELHGDEQRKPFTVSGLRRETRSAVPASDPGGGAHGGRGADAHGIRAGDKFSLRLTSFSSELSDVLLGSVLPSLPSTVRLGPVHFESGGPLYESGSHPWAGQGSADQLLSKWLGNGKVAPRQVDLEFASPTAFKRQGRLLVVPVPANIFQSYLMAWNAYASPVLDEDLLRVVERDVLLTHYHLRTRTVPLGPGMPPTATEGRDRAASGHQFGFAGSCTCTCFSPEPALRRALHLLADFAFFCGTGYKTTQGMGQTRKLGGGVGGEVPERCGEKY